MGIAKVCVFLFNEVKKIIQVVLGMIQIVTKGVSSSMARPLSLSVVSITI